MSTQTTNAKPVSNMAGLKIAGTKPNPKHEYLTNDYISLASKCEDKGEKRIYTREEYEELKSYSKKLRETAEAVKAQNESELEYAKSLLNKLKDEKYHHCELPILAHNFTLLYPEKRFLIYDMTIKLLERVKSETKMFSSERRTMKFYIDTIKDVKKHDTEPDIVAASVQPGLTTFWSACSQFGIAPTEKMIDILNEIKEYIIDNMPAIFRKKGDTIQRCEDLLSKKLVGDGPEPTEFAEEAKAE